MSLNNHSSFIAPQGVLCITQPPIIPWDLSDMLSLDITNDHVNMYTDCIGYDIGNDGMVMYAVSTQSDVDIDIYNFTTAYELGSASTNEYVRIAYDGLRDITFNNDGTKCLTLHHESPTLGLYVMWDVTIPYDFKNGRILFNTNSIGPSSTIVCSFSDSKIMAMLLDGKIVSWDIEDYDVSSMTNYQVAGISTTGSNDFSINQDGTQLVTVGEGVCKFYTLSTPYDIQSLTFVRDVPIPDSGYDKTITVRGDGISLQIGDYTTVKTFICNSELLDFIQYNSEYLSFNGSLIINTKE